MRADSELRRFSGPGWRHALRLAGIVVLGGALLAAAPSAAQDNAGDAQATQEEKALDDLLGDEDEIEFKHDRPPPDATGDNNRDERTGGRDAPGRAPDPDRVITAPAAVEPDAGAPSKEQEYAARVYVDREIAARLARVAGRVPDEELDHYVVYTPSPAARENPRLEALERRLWKQRLAEHKAARLEDALLNALDDEQAEPRGERPPDESPAGAPTPDKQGGRERRSFFERLFGSGGDGGAGSPGSADEREDIARRAATGQAEPVAADRAAGGAAAPDPVDRRLPEGTGEQPLGTVTLGAPPAAGRRQPTAFDRFVADSGLADAPPDAGNAAANSDRRDAAGDASGGGAFAGVPKAKPSPVPPPPAGSTGQKRAESDGAALPTRPSAAAKERSRALAVEPPRQSVAASPAEVAPATDTKVAPPAEPASRDSSPADAVSDAGSNARTDDALDSPGGDQAAPQAGASDTPRERPRASGGNLADRVSFAREIAALSADAPGAPPGDLAAPSRESDRQRRMEFERAAKQKFLDGKPLSPREAAYIDAAKRAARAKTQKQVDEQLQQATAYEARAAEACSEPNASAAESERDDTLPLFARLADAARRISHALFGGRPKVGGEEDPVETVGTDSAGDRSAGDCGRVAGASAGQGDDARQITKLERQARQARTGFEFDNCIRHRSCGDAGAPPALPGAGTSEAAAGAAPGGGAVRP